MKDYNSPQILQQQAHLVLEHVEDIVEHICDENRLSGEKVWVMINALSEAKINEYPQLNEDEEWLISSHSYMLTVSLLINYYST